MKTLIVINLVLMIALRAVAQEKIPLYPEGIPNSKGENSEEYQKNIPELFIYKPTVADKHVGILVIPGGGYAHVAIGHEGHDVARELNKNGYTAFVLRYRLPSDQIMKDKKIGPLQDAQRAMQLIRENQQVLGVDIRKLGVMGFSAGGHLASTLSTHYRKAYIANDLNTDLRPDFSILCYPVISMDTTITHAGSRKNLLGPNPGKEDEILFSNELQVDKNTAPAFLMSAKDDKAVPVENMYRYQRALQKYKIPNEVFTYENGGHGFGLNNKTSEIKWLASCLTWLEKLK
ncbi:alpha/beta hydrolase [Sphingobacterium spiritivorum]|uniref:alpha/beta hydrolase n=1 Tax=Sphingobacterium spiritivorum TaxID=258 RepID=UPI003DA46A7C